MDSNKYLNPVLLEMQMAEANVIRQIAKQEGKIALVDQTWREFRSATTACGRCCSLPNQE
jgi:hypothetical protein